MRSPILGPAKSPPMLVSHASDADQPRGAERAERRPVLVRRSDRDRRVRDADVGDRGAELVGHIGRCQQRVLGGQVQTAAKTAGCRRDDLAREKLDADRTRRSVEPKDALLGERGKPDGVGERLSQVDQVAAGDRMKARTDAQPASRGPGAGEAHVLHAAADSKCRRHRHGFAAADDLGRR